MSTIRNFLLTACLILVVTDQALGHSNEHSVTIGLGETYAPSNIRVTWPFANQLDFGIDMRSALLYSGLRVWTNDFAVGFGGAFGNGLAVYGLGAYRMVFWEYFVFDVEFWSVATTFSKVRSSGILSLGVVW